MKKILIILLLAFGINAVAQTTIEFKFLQDNKLAFLKDDHGNTPFTLDIRGEVNFTGMVINNVGWMTIGINTEIADLYGGQFLRYGFQGGFTFGYMNFFNLFNYQFTPQLGVGVIQRKKSNHGYLSLEAILDFDFKLNYWLDLSFRAGLMQRGDLSEFNDSTSKYTPWDWQPQFSTGITFKIPVLNHDKNNEPKNIFEK